MTARDCGGALVVARDANGLGCFSGRNGGSKVAWGWVAVV